MKIFKIFALVLLTLASFNLAAQVLGKNYGSSFYLTGGYAYINQNELQVLVPEGSRNIKNHYAPFGFGFQHQVKGYIAGVDANFLQSGTKFKDMTGGNDDGITTRSKIFKATFNFGYAVVDLPKFKFYPMIGIGHSRMDFNITNEGDITLTKLNDGESLGNEYNLKLRNFLLDFSLRLDHVLGKTDENGVTKGIVHGFRIGYQYAVKNNKWKHQGGDLKGAPDFGPSGFYAQLSVGFGKFSKEKMFCKHPKKSMPQ